MDAYFKWKMAVEVSSYCLVAVCFGVYVLVSIIDSYDRWKQKRKKARR